MYEEKLEALQVIMDRKSVRDFIERDVEEEKRKKIYQAILAAPTTENMMMYSVISVNDPETRAKLSKQPAIRKAPMVLVFCADYRRWNIIFEGMTESGRNPQEGEYQLAVVDTVVAAQNAVLAAEALGLSSVYLGDIMEHYEDRAAALGCPVGVVPVVTLCIGYATEAQLNRPYTKRLGQRYLIHDERYQDFSREELLRMLQERGQYESLEQMQPWLEKFSKRCVEGKGALERVRSIRTALRAMDPQD
ncbi:nitroreductase family protein [uncultured Dysosmobacter sp.]|uniref:nitroreductase family protein n=1 Tax=uncultured Dysosmobacter sp. TaxID=2591384 RepID=UPI00262A8C68|nr:nitroreductase family protein [uncultured Dysosmobacter sp.]